MREIVKQFVRTCAKTLPISEPIYEFGSLQVPGQEGFADLRPFFRGKEYVGADMRDGPGVDVILDLHKVELASGSAGAVLVMDTLEHVEFPWKAMDEIHRILKPNGILLVSSVMNFGIHEYPHDYWRFTPEAFRSILKHFTYSVVDSVGEVAFPHTVVGIGFKGSMSEDVLKGLMAGLDQWKKGWESSNAQLRSGKQLVKMFTPPILLNLVRST